MRIWQEHFAYTLGTEFSNSRWIRRMFDRKLVDLLGGEPAVCAGLFGSNNLLFMRRYL